MSAGLEHPDDGVEADAAAASSGAAADDVVDAAVDNDILIKAAVLDLADALVAARAGVLGQARFVVASRVMRMPLRGDAGAAAARAEELLARCRALEPDDQET